MSKQSIKIVKEFNTWRHAGQKTFGDEGYPKRLGEALDEVVAMADRYELLREAIEKTLEENGHLADGENCTLIHLKRALGVERSAPAHTPQHSDSSIATQRYSHTPKGRLARIAVAMMEAL